MRVKNISGQRLHDGKGGYLPEIFDIDDATGEALVAAGRCEKMRVRKRGKPTKRKSKQLEKNDD